MSGLRSDEEKLHTGYGRTFSVRTSGLGAERQSRHGLLAADIEGVVKALWML